MIFHEFYPPKKCMLYMSSMVMQNRLNQRGGAFETVAKIFCKIAILLAVETFLFSNQRFLIKIEFFKP